jgi:hypothetical protein
MHRYTVAEENNRLVTAKAGNMKLFLQDLDDLHQLDFVHNQQMVREIERLRVRLTTIDQQRESWKVRALMAEAQLLEGTAKPNNNGGRANVSDLRYASLKRYLASSSILITPLDKASRRLSETRSLRKSGTRLSASIKECLPPAPGRRNHPRGPDRAISAPGVERSSGGECPPINALRD